MNVTTVLPVSVSGPGTESTPMRSADRIGFLDGFRAIAILAVLGFHYYSRFGTDPRSIYPFADAWSGLPLFHYGFYGVHLFFSVSGFVISLTLMRCDTLAEFVVRRLARLWPTMLVCACLTYLFLLAFPMFFPQRPANFLPSLTFVDGRYFEKLFPGGDFHWIDGAYWSLFVEVRFYALAAALYFIGRARFLAHVLGFYLAAFAGYYILRLSHHAQAAEHLHQLLILTYLPWFLFGIAAHCLWLGKSGWAVVLAVAGLAPIFAGGLIAGAWADYVVAMCICAGFWLCFRFAAIRALFSMRWLTAIGVSSYSLYLLHQNIGVTLTSVLARAWSVPSIVSLGLPVLTAVAMLVVARLIYTYWETPLNALIVRSYLRRGRIVQSVG